MNDEPSSPPGGELRASESRSPLQHANPDAVIHFGSDRSIHDYNETAAELFGLTPEVLGRDIYDLHENDYEALNVDLIHASDHFVKSQRTFDEGVRTRSELVLIDGDQRRELEVVWAPVEENGEITGVVGSYRDISRRPSWTERFAYETRQVERDRRLLASIVDSLETGVIVFDADGAAELANRAARRFVGAEGPLEGLQFEEVAGASGLEAPDRLVGQFDRTRTEQRTTEDIHWRDASEATDRALSIQMRPLDETSDRILCTVRSTTFSSISNPAELLRTIPTAAAGEETFESAAQAAVEIVDQYLPVDFVVVTKRDEEAFRPIAWRGVMIDETLRVDADDDPSVDHVLESTSPRRFDAWPWERNTDEDGKIVQWALPLVDGDAPIGALHLGRLTEATSGVDAPDLAGDEGAFYETLARILGAVLGRAGALESQTRIERRLEAIIDAIPDGLVVYDRHGSVLYANDAARDFSRSWDNLNTDQRPYQIRRPDGEILPRSDWPFFRAVRRETDTDEELVLDYGDENRTVRVSAAPLEPADEPSEIFIGRIEDVSERREVDRRRDEFLSIASHELRSPLTPLTGILQLARRQRERGEEVDLALLSRAERQVTRLTRLIDGLLDLTRIETGRIELEPRDVELGTFVEQHLEPWQHHDDDVDIEIATPEADVWLRADPERIGQVLTNIVDNAVEYSDAEASIRVELREQSDRVELAVEDDGVGMEQEVVENIFDRFYHAADSDGDQRSMGLGLYICRQIVEQHGGDIAIDTAPGEGTRVEMTLPNRPPSDD